MHINREYKKLAVFLLCLAVLKIAFVFLSSRHYSISTSFVKDLFTSVLNTENIVSLTNTSRKEAGLGSLKISGKLEKAAQQKAQDMLKNEYFAHNTPSNKTPWDFMADAGYSYLFAGENLAMNFNSAEAVTTGWLTSPGHRENILSDKYMEMGIGIAQGKFLSADTTIVVQMFGKPFRSTAHTGKVSAKIKTGKVKAVKRPNVLLARSSAKPVVKGASVENYIAQLQNSKMADWSPKAKIHQIYSPNEDSMPADVLLDMLFLYVAVSGACIIVYRCFKAYLKAKTA